MFAVVPIPTVNVTVPKAQIVGQSLTLKCSGTTVRGITSRVLIVWRRNNIIVASTSGVIPTIMNNSQVYTNFYTILQLSTADNGVMYQCKLDVRENVGVNANDIVKLHVTGK